MRVKVEAYSGYRAEERPLRFTLGDRVFQVGEILDRWYGPDHAYFKVRADDANIYILRYSAGQDAWSLEMFQQDGRQADPSLQNFPPKV